MDKKHVNGCFNWVDDGEVFIELYRGWFNCMEREARAKCALKKVKWRERLFWFGTLIPGTWDWERQWYTKYYSEILTKTLLHELRHHWQYLYRTHSFKASRLRSYEERWNEHDANKYADEKWESFKGLVTVEIGL